jgi:hypothetical protein
LLSLKVGEEKHLPFTAKMAPPQRKRNREELERKYASKPEAVVTVEDFAHRKGIKKGLQKYRERKQSKRIQVSKALRYYKKAMKQEGYTPGTGISRKREDDQEKDEIVVASLPSEQLHTTDALDSKDETMISSKKSQHSRPKQQILDVNDASRQRTNRQQQKHRPKKERENASTDRELVKEQKLLERQKRHKLLVARTSKGQPIMNHIVQDILHKLEKKKQSNQE